MGRRKGKDFSNTGIQFGFNSNEEEENDSSNIFDEIERASATSDPLLQQIPQRGLRRTLEASNGRIQRGQFIMTMTGLEYVGGELSLDDWKEMGQWLYQLKDSIQWMIGDWANLAEDHIDTWSKPDGTEFETRYAELLKATDYSYSTLRKLAHYASAVPVFRRRNTLSFSHHVEVARVPDEEQDRFLNMAEPNEIRKKPMSVRELRELIYTEYPPEQLESGKKSPLAKKDVEADMLRVGLDLVRKKPKLSDKTKSDALKAAEIYRKLAEQLESYANPAPE